MGLRAVWQGSKVAFLIVGTTIGAGYASGRELWEFFGSYGPEGQLALLVAIFLFSISCYIVMDVGRRLKAAHYRLVLEEMIGRRLAQIYDVLILLYLLSTTVVMFAGSGVALDYWDYSYWTGVCLIALLVCLVFLRETEGILILNSILTPVMVGILMIACIQFLLFHKGGRLLLSERLPEALSSAIVFTALNILPLVAVLSVIGSGMKKSEMSIATLMSGIILALLSLLYNQSLLHIHHLMDIYEIPLFALFQDFRVEWLVGVSVVLWVAIYTTAVSNMFGLVSRIKGRVNQPAWLVSLVLVIIMMPLSGFGFTRLIQVLYPLYGVLNLFLLCMILLYPLSSTREEINKL